MTQREKLFSEVNICSYLPQWNGPGSVRNAESRFLWFQPRCNLRRSICVREACHGEVMGISMIRRTWYPLSFLGSEFIYISPSFVHEWTSTHRILKFSWEGICTVDTTTRRFPRPNRAKISNPVAATPFYAATYLLHSNTSSCGSLRNKMWYLNLDGSLRCARKQTTWHQLLHGEKVDGVGGWTLFIEPPLPGWFGWVRNKIKWYYAGLGVATALSPRRNAHVMNHLGVSKEKD